MWFFDREAICITALFKQKQTLEQYDEILKWYIAQLLKSSSMRNASIKVFFIDIGLERSI